MNKLYNRHFKKIIQQAASLFLAAAMLNCNILEEAIDEASQKQTNTGLTFTLGAGGVHIVGPSVFTVVAAESGAPVPGLNLSVTPKMHMDSGMVHSTPVDSVTDNNDGTYTVTAYYLMPSMGGYWEIEISANNSSAAIPVTVTGSMMDRAILKGVSDLFLNMGLSSVRNYYIFVDSVAGAAGSRDVSLFVATRENVMFHPAVYNGQTLNDEAGTPWTINGLALEIYDASDAWVPLADNGNGHYSAAGVNIGMTLHIRLKVSADGLAYEQKTTDGAAFDGGLPTATDPVSGAWVSNGFAHIMVQ